MINEEMLSCTDARQTVFKCATKDCRSTSCIKVVDDPIGQPLNLSDYLKKDPCPIGYLDCHNVKPVFFTFLILQWEVHLANSNKDSQHHQVLNLKMNNIRCVDIDANENAKMASKLHQFGSIPMGHLSLLSLN